MRHATMSTTVSLLLGAGATAFARLKAESRSKPGDSFQCLHRRLTLRCTEEIPSENFFQPNEEPNTLGNQR